MDTPITPSIDELKRRIDGMRAKEQEFKRFKSRYQGSLKQVEMYEQMYQDLQREQQRLLRTVAEIAKSEKDFRRRDMIDYCRKTLAGLGYE